MARPFRKHLFDAACVDRQPIEYPPDNWAGELYGLHVRHGDPSEFRFVIRMSDGGTETFSGDTECWREGGVLSVRAGERYTVYSPSGWAQIEANEPVFGATPTVAVEGSVAVEGPVSAYVSGG